MKKTLSVGAILLLDASILLTLGAKGVMAQGPAGTGADTARDSSLSINPLKWAKRDSKSSTATPGNRSDIERKLTPSLQAHGVLAANATVTDACVPFTALDGCLAALHASHSLGVDFNCLRADITGVHTNADMSGCRFADGERTQSLNKAIHQLKPDANAKQATKDAEQQAREDLKEVGG